MVTLFACLSVSLSNLVLVMILYTQDHGFAPFVGGYEVYLF